MDDAINPVNLRKGDRVRVFIEGEVTVVGRHGICIQQENKGGAEIAMALLEDGIVQMVQSPIKVGDQVYTESRATWHVEALAEGKYGPVAWCRHDRDGFLQTMPVSDLTKVRNAP